MRVTRRGKKSISVILRPFTEWYQTAITSPSSSRCTIGFA